MSATSELRIRSIVNEVVAKVAEAAFLDQGFINTMRFTELIGDEEYDNTFLGISWYAYLQMGMNQVREQAADFKQAIAEKDPQWEKLSKGIKDRNIEFVAYADSYDYNKPVDDKKNMWIISNKLARFNTNLMYGDTLFHRGHIMILNGRMARGKGHKQDLLELGKSVDRNEKDIELGDEKKKRFWNRGSGE
jgi:hypothetical protein